MKLVSALLAAATVLSASRVAAAQTICAPMPSWNTAPKWWDPPGQTQAEIRFDGRWSGATQQAYGTGLSATGRFRAVVVADELYLSWQLDQGLAATPALGARLYLGIAPPEADGTVDIAKARFYRIHMKSPTAGARSNEPITCDALPATAAHCKNVDVISGLKVFGHDGAAGDVREKQASTAALTLEPWWVLSSQTWSDSTGITIQLRIPSSAIGNVGEYKLWFEFRNCPAGNPDTGASCTRDVRFPVGVTTPASEIDVVGERVLTYPPTTDWGTLRLNTTCGEGYDLDASRIGSIPKGAAASCEAAVAGHALTWNDTKFMGTGDNCLIARPRNAGTTPLPNNLTAEFYLANWGSAADFDLAQAEWLAMGTASSPSATPVPGNGEVDLTTSYSLNTATRCKFSSPIPDNGGDTSADCTNGTTAVNSNNPEDPAYRAACCSGVPEAWTRKRHQCMQVKLKSSGAVPFVRDSALMNMDFVPASRFWRIATLSTAAMPEGERVLYLYARATNLPASAPGSIPIADASAQLADYQAKFGRPPPGIQDPWLNRLRGRKKQLDELLGNPNGDNDDLDPGPQQQQRGLQVFHDLAPEVVREVFPTLEVHVYRESKDVAADGATPIKLLDAQAGFGYFVEHVGTIDGWSWAIDGAESLGNGWYKVTTKGDEVDIRTRIQSITAEDARPQPDGIRNWPPENYWLHRAPTGGKPITVAVDSKGGCSAGRGGGGGGLALVVLALGAGLRRRRRQSSPSAG